LHLHTQTTTTYKTYPLSLHDALPIFKKLAYSLVHKPIRIQISPKDPVNKNIDHGVSFVEQDDKRFFLERIIKENIGQKILVFVRSEEHTSELQSRENLVCRLLLEKKK